MPINMTCPSCGKPLTAPESAVGKRAKCPGCAQVMIVPDAVFETELVGDHFGQHSYSSLGTMGSAGHADPWLRDTASVGRRADELAPANCAGRVRNAAK